jgi:hypothetical protein
VIPPERLREITSWLQQPIGVAEAVARVVEFDGIARNPIRGGGRSLQAWIQKHMQPDDELWWYDTGGESWANLRGESGFAVLRGGKVVEFYTWLEN